LEAVAAKFDLHLQQGTIIDPSARLYGVNQASVVAIGQYESHPVTENFRYLTLFPEAVGLTAKAIAPWEQMGLFTTHEKSWSETGELKSAVKFDAGQDIAGPFTLGWAFERPLTAPKPEAKEKSARQQRIIVIGDGDFLANTFVANGGNLDLGLKIINWLARDDQFVSIAAKSNFDTRLELSPAMAIFLGLLFLLILPFSLFGTGMGIWLRRRNA
jgi:hypothetical protein